MIAVIRTGGKQYTVAADDQLTVEKIDGEAGTKVEFTDVLMVGDKIGARKVLVRVVLWWSFFTAATGWAWNFASMWVTRFLFGAGEAGCFPNLTKAF
eukprot:gene7623-9716_t